MPDPIIRTEHLTKRYDDLAAVQDLDLHIYPGEIYGLLGPNGAGKTTTMLMLLGILPPTEGRIYLFGDLTPADAEARRRIGVVPENQYLYEDMTAHDFLQLFADIYEVERAEARIAELLSRVGLSERAVTRVKGFSHGMKQRLSIARALLHDPDILVLDEPVLGLDPYGIRDVREIIQEQNEAGKTILISSHVLSEVEKTATRVGILRKGQLIAEEDVGGLRRRFTEGAVVELELRKAEPRIVQGLQKLVCVSRVIRQGRRLRISTDGSEESLGQISQRVSSLGGVVLGMRTDEVSLEEAFFTITEGNVERVARGLG
jgi:ABC-2 type transport system ATP-binding protein